MKRFTSFRMTVRRRLLLAQAILGFSVFLTLIPFVSRAADFVLDPGQSRITLSGVIDYQLAPIYGNLSGDAPLEEQGPGSLETGYIGILRAEVTDSTITFSGDSEIAALDSGQWDPGINGTGPATNASYGADAVIATFTFKLALRSVKLDLISEALPLSDGAFDAQAVAVHFPTNDPGQADYSFLTLTGRLPLSGALSNQTAVATLTETGEVQTLTIPIDTSAEFPSSGSYGTITVRPRLSGQLVGMYTNLAPFRILSVTTTPELVTINWETISGHDYQVEWSTNLLDWILAADGLSALSDTLSWSTNRVHPATFFRVSR